MKRFLLAGATLLALTLAQPTLAADAPIYKGPAPVAAALFNWSSFYLGISGGWARAETAWTNTGTGIGTGNFTGDGGLIGGTIGWNWQAPGSALVLGVEGDWSWANVQANQASIAPFFCGGAPAGCHAKLESLATFRGRLGWANGAFLLYAMAGGAWGQIRNFEDALFDSRVSQTGWTAGGGIEVAVAGNWSVKGEYLYMAFPQSGAFFITGGGNPLVHDYYRLHIFRVGANVRF